MRVTIVGASLAGLRAAETLRRLGHDGPITFVGAEPHRPYDRPPLSKQVLTGKVPPQSTALPVPDSIEAEWRLGVAASRLDLDRRVVALADGEEVPFDQLIIATGAAPRTLAQTPLGPGVHVLRTLDDAQALHDELTQGPRVAVIGAGFIGLEVASSCRQLGLHVTVLEALPVPLGRALGEAMGRRSAQLQTQHGVELRLGAKIVGLVGEGGVAGVELADGEVVPADVVVVGVGVAPVTGWLEGSGVDLDDGVRCDAALRVYVDGRPRPDVVAAGDVARWDHPDYGKPVRVEHWTNAAEQGAAAAATLLQGRDAPAYAPVPYFWSDQHGTKIQFVGRAEPDDEMAVVDGELDADRFVVAYGRDGRLVAALGFGRPARVMALQRMIGEGAAFPLAAPA